MSIEDESINPDPESSTSSNEPASNLPAQQSFPSGPLGSKHSRISETSEGKLQLNTAAPMTESRQQLFDDLSKASADLDEESSNLNPPDQETDREGAESLEAAEPPSEPSAAPNKRDKDTERAYQKAQQELKKLQKDYEGIEPGQVKTYKEFYDKGLPVLQALSQLAERDPQRFQQLFDGAQSGPHVPSPEEMEDIQSDPAKYKEYLKTAAREAFREEIYRVPEIATLKEDQSNRVQVKQFIAKRFGGDPNHPDLVAAAQYFKGVFAEHQQRGEPITLEKAYAEYLRAKEHFASTGTAGKASNNGKAKTSGSTTPESSPQQNPTPLPQKYPGVAGRVTDPFAGLQGMTRRQKIEEMGKRLSARDSRFSR